MSGAPIPRLRGASDGPPGQLDIRAAVMKGYATYLVNFDLFVNGPSGDMQIVHASPYDTVTFGGHFSSASLYLFDAPVGGSYWFQINTNTVLTIESHLNVGFIGSTPSFRGAVGVGWMGNATTEPGAVSTDGFFFWSRAGAMIVQNESGVVTTLSPPLNGGGPAIQVLDRQAPAAVLSGTTPADLLTYAVPDDATVHVSARVTFDRTDSTTDGAGVTVSGVVKRRAAGVATLVGAPLSVAFADAGLAAVTCVLGVDGGNNLTIHCVGVAGATIEVFADVDITLQAR